MESNGGFILVCDGSHEFPICVSKAAKTKVEGLTSFILRDWDSESEYEIDKRAREDL